MIVRMRGQHSAASTPANCPTRMFTDAAETLGHVFTVGGDKYFPIGLQKHFNTFPVIRDNACAGACGFEHASCRREAVASHAFAADVENHPRAAIERIVLMRINVAQIPDIGWHRLVAPAATAQQEY